MNHKSRTPITLALAAATLAGALGLTACSSDADVASANLSKKADNFEILRRIVFINGITDKYLLVIEGYCALDAGDAKKITVTCKRGPDDFIKNYLGLSDNVTYMVEQMKGEGVSTDHYIVNFKPEALIPDVQKR